MHPSPLQMLLASVLTGGVGALMIRIGLQSKLLEWRPRRCPACGRLNSSGDCPRCCR